MPGCGADGILHRGCHRAVPWTAGCPDRGNSEGIRLSAKMRASLAFDAASVDLDSLLKRLHLANAGRNWRTMVERAEAERWSCRELLGVLVTEEVAQRQQTRIQRAVHQAHFPFLKTVDDFDFSLQSSLFACSFWAATFPLSWSARDVTLFF